MGDSEKGLGQGTSKRDQDSSPDPSLTTRIKVTQIERLGSGDSDRETQKTRIQALTMLGNPLPRSPPIPLSQSLRSASERTTSGPRASGVRATHRLRPRRRAAAAVGARGPDERESVVCVCVFGAVGNGQARPQRGGRPSYGRPAGTSSAAHACARTHARTHARTNAHAHT